jgi:hypothetical protein
MYSASARPYHGLSDVSDPLHDRDVMVTARGPHLHAPQTHLYLNRIVSFMQYDLGCIYLEQKSLLIGLASFGEIEHLTDERTVTESGHATAPDGESSASSVIF